MATYTENYSLVKPGYGDSADIDVLNRLMTDKVDALLFENRRISADEYDQEESYAVGDYAIYENVLYKCIEDTTGNFDPSKWEMTNLAKELSTKGGADVTKTASGNPITFDDGASAPLVKCVTEIQGSQDLHGYDKPWVGGSGKNKLPMTVDGIKAENTSGTWSGDSYTLNGITFAVETDTDGNVADIKVTGTASEQTDFRVTGTITVDSDSILNGCPAGGSTETYNLRMANVGVDRGNGLNVPNGSSGYVYIRIYSGYAANLIYYPMLRLSTVSDATFAPYSNICPISGYSSVGVNVAGKNLVDGYINTTSNPIVVSLLPNTYTISANGTLQNSNWYLRFADKNGAYTYNANQVGLTGWTKATSGWVYGGGGTQKVTFIVPDGCSQIEIGKLNENGTVKAQIELGTSATDYEEYQGNTYTIPLGDTYYSGQIDVVKGVLVADKAEFICDGTESGWSKSTTTACDVYMAASPFSAFNFNNVYMTDKFAYTPERNYNTVGYTWRGSSNKQLRVGFADYNTSTVASFKTWLGNNPLQIVADLETPLEIPLTPTTIKSLLGNNTMWTDGDNLEIEYITQDYQPLVDLIESGNGHTYSTSEQIVGKWTDGKDVYEKTFYYATLSCDRSDWAQLEALDAETFISYSATAHMETASGRQIDNAYIRISYYNGYLYHHEPEFGTGMVDLYVTVRYTKPTTPTRSLNLTKSAVTEELPDEIKNAEYEEKPETNEADDDAPTEVER